MGRLDRVVLEQPPSGIQATANSSSAITVTWQNNRRAASYRVYRNGTLVGSPTGLTYADSGLSASTAYSYTVASVGADGLEGPQSNAVNGTTLSAADTTGPTAPTISATATGSTTIRVNLVAAATDAQSGVASYRVEYKASASSTWVLAAGTVLVGAFPYTVSGLSASTAYDFRVRATDNASNVGAYSAVVSATTQAATGFQLPELPRVTVDTTYTEPTGNVWTATNTSTLSVAGTGDGNRTGCSFLYALTNCARGDKIVLTAGATYTGPYQLPTKAGTGWIYITSSALPGFGLPPVGVRVTPADVAGLAKIQAANAGPIRFGPDGGANYYRLVGLELCPTAGVGGGSGIVRVLREDGDTVYTNPTHITIDRCYLHGESWDNPANFGVVLAGSNIAVINSYLDAFGAFGTERQAILGYTGGPYHIENCHISGAGECMMLGGGGLGIGTPEQQSLICSDIVIRGNHFTLPTSIARSTNPRLTVKNLLEFKTGQRILVEGNLFTNMWGGQGQNGRFLLITPRNQGGLDPYNYTRDIWVRNNKAINVCAGFGISGGDTDQPYDVVHTDRIRYENNLVVMNGWICTETPGVFAVDQSGMLGVNMQATPRDNIDGLPGDNYSLVHNTFAWDPSITSVGSGGIGNWTGYPDWQCNNVEIKDNLFHYGAYGVRHAFGYTSGGTNCLAALSANYVFAGNGMYPISGVSATWPAGTLFASSVAATGFVDYANGDYRLASGSPFRNAATDGGDIGCNISVLEAAMND